MPLPPILGPIIMGLLSAGGTLYQNKQNRKEAQKTMDFQERMSSTAAQRSVADYRAAGLNPALAYDRSASSPGGVTATIGDPAATGIASANTARQLRIAQQQHSANMQMMGAQFTKATYDAANAKLEGDLLEQQYRFNNAIQPSTARTLAAEAMLREYSLAGAKNEADYELMMGKMSRGLGSAKTAAEILSRLIPNIRRSTINPTTIIRTGKP